MNNTEKQTVETVAPVVLLSVSAIIPDPRNRKVHDEERLKLLAESIAGEGLLQAIVVRAVPAGIAVGAGVTHMIIAGERRWRAHKLLGRDVIQATVVESDDQAKVVRRRAAENMHRENLTPIEEAALCQELVETGMKQAEVATFMGYGAAATVANQIRLLKLPAAVSQMVHEGTLSRAHGVALVRFAAWPKVCTALARLVVKNGMSAKELERHTLPFGYQLREQKLVVQLESWNDGYSWTKAMGEDPDWVKDGSWYLCLNYEKGMEEKARQDAAVKAREVKAAEKKKELAAKGEKTPEQIERAQVREKKKKALRENLVVRMDELKQVLDGKTGADAQLWRYLGPRLLGGFSRKCLETSAALLGLQVPDGVLGSWNGVDAGAADKLTANEWQRWAIYTAAHKACEDHAKYSDAGEPSMVTMLLGKQKRPPSLAKKATAEKRRKAAAKK